MFHKIKTGHHRKSVWAQALGGNIFVLSIQAKSNQNTSFVAVRANLTSTRKY